MNERLTARDISQFLIGREDAIRKVAGSSAAVWTGIALTFLTAVAWGKIASTLDEPVVTNTVYPEDVQQDQPH